MKIIIPFFRPYVKLQFMIEKPGYDLGSQKIVRYFEYKGHNFVRIESRLGWNKNEALLTFHLARIAYLLFPDNIPYPRLVRRSASRENTYSIFAEFIPHDDEHAYVTRLRNENGGLTNGISKADKERLKGMDRVFNSDPKAKSLREKFNDSGFISSNGGGFELDKWNVIVRKGELVFIDFVNPFYIAPEGYKPTWVPRVDFKKIKEYAFEHCSPEKFRLILLELENIYYLLPDNQKSRFQYLIT